MDRCGAWEKWTRRLGDGTEHNTSERLKVIDSNVSMVAAGGNHSLFLGDNGSLWAMGANDRGQLEMVANKPLISCAGRG